MRKIISVFSALAMAFGSLAFAPPAQAVVPFWDVTGPWVAGFQLDGVGPVYLHDMFLTQDGFGNVTGNGGYLAGSPPYSYHWNITSGSVSGGAISLTMDYDVGAVGTTMHMTGAIAPDGSTMSGDWDDNLSGGRVGTWETTSGAAVWLDADDDGVFGGADLCPGTESDTGKVALLGLGVNRWMWKGGSWWTTDSKTKVPGPSDKFSMEYTKGCSAFQILENLQEATGKSFDGHYKYGASKSILEDWHNNRYYLETVVVPANDVDGVSSNTVLQSGYDYELKASGTAFAGDGIEFDADYSFRVPTSATWTDAVSTYEYLGDSLLDLQVNGSTVGWDDDAVYNADHIYWYELAGAGAPVSFQVNDVFYPNNTGSLAVDIFVELY